MTDKDIQEYYKTVDGGQVKRFIEFNRQDAVVYSVTIKGDQRYIQCWSPVWKTIRVSSEIIPFDIEVQRGDIVTLSRYKIFPDDTRFIYNIVGNKTADKIRQDSIDKILKDFDAAQKQNILLISEYQKFYK